MNEHLKIILEEMCERVDTTFERVDFQKKDWYTEHSWSEKEQDSFKEWLEEYLYNNTEARRAVMNIPMKDKKRISSTAGYFLLSYGWTLEE